MLWSPAEAERHGGDVQFAAEGPLTAERVDAALWDGAAAAGWTAVRRARRGRVSGYYNTYRSPDGTVCASAKAAMRHNTEMTCTWACCDVCGKWRRLSAERAELADGDAFACAMLEGVSCEQPQDELSEDEEEEGEELAAEAAAGAAPPPKRARQHAIPTEATVRAASECEAERAEQQQRARSAREACGSALVGARIRVFWHGCGRWFAGRVAEMKPGGHARTFRVEYDDGDVKVREPGPDMWTQRIMTCVAYADAPPSAQFGFGGRDLGVRDRCGRRGERITRADRCAGPSVGRDAVSHAVGAPGAARPVRRRSRRPRVRCRAACAGQHLLITTTTAPHRNARARTRLSLTHGASCRNFLSSSSTLSSSRTRDLTTWRASAPPPRPTIRAHSLSTASQAFLLELDSTQQLDTVARDVQMRIGHARKFCHWFRKAAVRVADATEATVSPPAPAPDTNAPAVSPIASAASSAPTASSPAESGVVQCAAQRTRGGGRCQISSAMSDCRAAEPLRRGQRFCAHHGGTWRGPAIKRGDGPRAAPAYR